MKKIITAVLVISFLSFTMPPIKLTDAERQLAKTELTTSQNNLLKALNGLSERQLNFKADANSWSIAECVEHLALSENNIFGMLQGSVETPSDASRRSEVTLSDQDILKMVADRSQKLKTGKPFEPSGKFGSFEGTIKEFMTKRKASIAYVMSTEDDLRNHYATFPVGTIDAYQMLLFMSAHTHRHLGQIDEVMAHSAFPSK